MVIKKSYSTQLRTKFILLIHARIQDFSSGGGGGGVQVSLTKKALTTFFFLLVLSLFSEVKWSISNKSIIFQGSRGGPTFSMRVQLFPGGGGGGGGGGSNCLFPIETHMTCDFPGGSGPPVPPSGSALVINIKMSTIVGILTLVSMIDIQHLRDLKQETFLFVGILAFMTS